MTGFQLTYDLPNSKQRADALSTELRYKSFLGERGHWSLSYRLVNNICLKQALARHDLNTFP